MTCQILTSEINRIGSVLFGPGVNSHTRLGYLIEQLEWASPPTILRAFHLFWSSCDDLWSYRNIVLELLRFVDCEVDKREYMKPDAIMFFDALLDPVRVFRGCSLDRIDGLSWTANQKIADGFAHGHRGIRVPDPVVASALIPKEAIFFVCVGRKEAEVVVDPDALIELVITPYISEEAS